MYSLSIKTLLLISGLFLGTSAANAQGYWSLVSGTGTINYDYTYSASVTVTPNSTGLWQVSITRYYWQVVSGDPNAAPWSFPFTPRSNNYFSAEKTKTFYLADGVTYTFKTKTARDIGTEEWEYYFNDDYVLTAVRNRYWEYDGADTDIILVD